MPSQSRFLSLFASSLQTPTANGIIPVSPRRRSELSSLLPPSTPLRPRSRTRISPPSKSPVKTLLDVPPEEFNFGAEFEIICRPKCMADLCSEVGIQAVPVPEFDAPPRQTRDFGLRLMRVIAKLLSSCGLQCEYFDPTEDESASPDYAKWHVTADGSVSKKHMSSGYYPVEIVMPVTRADHSWTGLIDRFWTVMADHFDFKQDSSCGFHVHVSPAAKSYSTSQLRQVAKAVVLWESQTARRAPLSRWDRVNDFCKSNVKHAVGVLYGRTELAGMISYLGPWVGTRKAFQRIDILERDDLVAFVCPDKYRAWNFRPSKTGGHGTVEFRRAPGVVTAKKAKHWIAFSMAFIDMALRFNPDAELFNMYNEFEQILLESAARLGIHAVLDARLHQTDKPSQLHLSSMLTAKQGWLRRRNPAYGSADNG